MSRARGVVGLSQGRLAERLISQSKDGNEGWTQTEIHEIERALSPRRIKLDEAQAIADALGTPLQSMLGLGPVSSASTPELAEGLKADLALSSTLKERLEGIHREINASLHEAEEIYLRLAETGTRVVAALTELYGRGELDEGVFADGEHQEAD